MGISNVPALLQTHPQSSLKSLGLGKYEISPTEPLHDLKGHIANIFAETERFDNEDVQSIMTQIRNSALNKETLRGSDYCKALLLGYIKLKESNADKTLLRLYSTAVRISQALYAHDEKRTPKAILALHNDTFQHFIASIQLFSTPKTMNRNKMFGRYFHSQTIHAAMMYRIISLRSLNVENQERMFGVLKSITKATSNNHPQQVIDNAIQMMQYEEENRKS